MKTKVLALAAAGPSRFILMALFVCTSASLPPSALASIFTGSYQAEFSYDDNIFDQVQIRSGAGNFLITPGAGPNDLNLQMDFGSKTVSVPLVTSRNLAILPHRNYDAGMATALDLVLLSDGNNMVLAYVEQEKAGPFPNPISFAVSHWQRSPAVVNPGALTGSWVSTVSYEDRNLRNTSDGFDPAGFSFAITKDVDPLSFTLDLTPDIPDIALKDLLHLTASGSRASLAGSPVTTPHGVEHTFDLIYDNTGFGSLFSVASELNDPTDVSINVSLLARAPVPEPSTALLFGTGIAAIGLLVRRKKVSKTRTTS